MNEHSTDASSEEVTSRSTRSIDRRSAVWSACDQLAATSVKPSLSKVRSIHRGGSDTDVQSDIQAWYARVFKGYCEHKDGLDLPGPVAALMQQVWEAAQSGAQAQLHVQREEAKAAIDLSQSQVQQAIKRLTIEEERRKEVELEVAAQKGTLAGLERFLEAKLREVEAFKIDLEAERDRNTRLESKLMDLEVAHAHSLAAVKETAALELSAVRKSQSEEISRLKTAHTQEVEGLSKAISDWQERYARETTLAEERVRSAEKRLMIEQDAVRHSTAEWRRRSESERAAAETKESILRQKAYEANDKAVALSAELQGVVAALAQARLDLQTARLDYLDLAKSYAPLPSSESATAPGSTDA